MCQQKNSGFVYTGCDCGQNNGLSDGAPASDASPKNKTQKDIQEEAEKYSNTEVPTHNKLFAGTLLIVTLMLINSGN